jgi:hypothetical protein
LPTESPSITPNKLEFAKTCTIATVPLPPEIEFLATATEYLPTATELNRDHISTRLLTIPNWLVITSDAVTITMARPVTTRAGTIIILAVPAITGNCPRPITDIPKRKPASPKLTKGFLPAMENPPLPMHAKVPNIPNWLTSITSKENSKRVSLSLSLPLSPSLFLYQQGIFK